MWVVSRDNVPCFWLTLGTQCTVGRKDCDILISDDASISRRHLLLVACPPSAVCASQTRPDHLNGRTHRANSNASTDSRDSTATHDSSTDAAECPFPLRLIDTSTYGSTALPSDEASDVPSDVCAAARPLQIREAVSPESLPRGAPFVTPPDWRAFALRLGTHGAALQLHWSPTRVFAMGLSPAQRSRLVAALAVVGAVPVSDHQTADFLVTSRLAPTPAAVAALCRAVPIVTPDFFDAAVALTAAGALVGAEPPRFPPPDAHGPPLSAAWDAVSPPGVSDWALPRPERRKLLAGLTLVTLERPLHAEADAFVPLAGGALLLDESIAARRDATRAALEALLAALAARHTPHILLHNHRDKRHGHGNPLHGVSGDDEWLHQCETALRERFGLRAVSYRELLRCILAVEPLLSRRPKRSRSPNGRPTDPKPLFRDGLDDAKGGGRMNSPHTDRKRGRDGEEGEEAEERRSGPSAPDKAGWRHCKATDAPHASAVVEMEAVPPAALPQLPLFASLRTRGRRVTGGKCFAKQSFKVGVAVVEFEHAVLPTAAVTARGIDDEDIVPNETDRNHGGNNSSSGNHLNSFTFAAGGVGGTHASTRSAIGAFDMAAPIGRQGRARRPRPASTATSASRTMGRHDTAEGAPMSAAETVPSESSGQRARGRGPVNIFDIEAIF